MALIGRQTLAGLQRLYKLAATKRAPDEIDIDAPVVVVHNVEPSAVLESGIHIVVGQARSALLGATSYGSNTAQDFIDNGLIAPLLERAGLVKPAVWILGAQMQAHVPPNHNLAECGHGISQGANYAANPLTKTLAYANARLANTPVTSGEGFIPYYDDGARHFPAEWVLGGVDPYPLLLTPTRSDSRVRQMVTADAGGPATVTFIYSLWFGPENHEPPRAQA